MVNGVVLLCGSFVFSVPLWWKTEEDTHHRVTENTENAQRFGN